MFSLVWKKYFFLNKVLFKQIILKPSVLRIVYGIKFSQTIRFFNIESLLLLGTFLFWPFFFVGFWSTYFFSLYFSSGLFKFTTVSYLTLVNTPPSWTSYTAYLIQDLNMTHSIKTQGEILIQMTIYNHSDVCNYYQLYNLDDLTETKRHF